MRVKSIALAIFVLAAAGLASVLYSDLSHRQAIVDTVDEVYLKVSDRPSVADQIILGKAEADISRHSDRIKLLPTRSMYNAELEIHSQLYALGLSKEMIDGFTEDMKADAAAASSIKGLIEWQEETYAKGVPAFKGKLNYIRGSL